VPASGEPVALKPQVTPLGKFIGMLLFALLWDGVIGVFVYVTFFSPNHASAPFLAKAFVGVFALIGLVIAGGAIGSFLALFNPRVRLTARTGAVPLGGEFQFQWSLAGRTEKLRKIRIVLEGREETVRRHGKHTETATQVFAEIPVVETSDHEILAEGQGRVVIPPGLMHTLNGRHNRILWRLRVRGEIPHWPDLVEDYPVIVLPRTATS